MRHTLAGLALGLTGAVLLLIGCGDPPAPTGPSVELVVDGTPAGGVTASEIGQRTELRDLLPQGLHDAGAWIMLDVRTDDARRRLQILRPAKRYPEQDFALYTAKDGSVGFGVYRRERDGLTPRERALLTVPAPYLEGVVRIHLRTTETEAEAHAREHFGKVELVVDGGTPVVVTAQALDALEALEPPPPNPETKDGNTGRPGLWSLRRVLRTVVDPDTIRSGRLIDLKGKAHELDVATLATDAQPRAALKRNRRGDHHVRFVEGRRNVKVVRSVYRIEVSTRE